MPGHRQHDADSQVAWHTLVKQAWLDRVGLSCTGFYMTPDIKYDFTTLAGPRLLLLLLRRGCERGRDRHPAPASGGSRPSTSCMTWARASTRPLTGARSKARYVQGMGWLTMEECVWSDKGKLLTNGPSTYKIPVAGDVPEHFKVSLFAGQNVKPTPYRSKAVGEPPLMLALSTYFALRDAVGASAEHRSRVDLDAPATPERILLACERARAARA
ncbi:MAG: molybdopterin-dependent oxidoreductase [Comamonadaceae bacterium]|nr:molybdopterin-dependent oxidoreductase [Comamonadaceae bacterium]